MFNKRVTVMVLECENYRFEKGAAKEVGTVNVINLHNGYEIDCFTDYTIGLNLDKMAESCEAWVKEHGFLEWEENN